MNLSAGRRTWEEAASPAAVLLAQKYEQAWRDSDHAGRRPNLHVFLGQAGAVDATARAPGWRCCGPIWRCDGRRARRSGRSGISTAIRTWAKTRSSRSSTKSSVFARKTTSTRMPAEYLDPLPAGCRVAGAGSADSRSGRLGNAGDGEPELDRRRGELRARPSSRRRARRSAVSLWSKSWDAGRSLAFFWPGSASLPIGRWRSRSRGAARESRRRSPGFSTPISCRCIRIGSTRPRGCICCACPISAG